MRPGSDFQVPGLSDLLINLRQEDQRLLTLGNEDVKHLLRSTSDDSIIRLLTCLFVVRKY